ncbi:iron-sulfur cluster carrier protein ApbC [Spectribacter hydrogenoxidans]|uniref:Iron-sulfur cluster carrier protein n=1 Tax=Spectribacter hydrogenoxidans TaxID=3075608 RepID=A0ABU3BXS4_9GAMM|nr:iron-sulfur cluster carrier protein ApbC [Salinisphaera sp. W335]MDT0634127.1 iron-sulfur cluster carrier protein ApbC [Salinisphaera sp. W335]
MSDSLQADIEDRINGYHDDLLGSTLGDARVLRGVTVDDGQVSARLRFGFPVKRHGPLVVAALRQQLLALSGVTEVDIAVESRIEPHAAPQGVERLKPVKNIIAVASGKGGVGKSTVAANLALALAGEGARVGVLDADIYGPSQPRMLGVSGKPRSEDGKHIIPMQSFGVQSMSIGYLMDDETPTVWRGPMVTQALQQLLNDTLWDDLDYLIVDMPPGTGDIQLTLSQRVPVSGAVIVTTPQDIATLDARKGLQMFRKVNVPVLGIVENMSLHTCSACGHEEHLFGAGGGQQVADRYEVPLLGAVPLEIGIREAADGGRPSVIADPDGSAARHFVGIALRMAAILSRQNKDYARKFPKITVENT